MPDRSRNILGIFNYCDRWCERCPYTSRCGSYELGKEVEAVKDDPDGIRQLFWKDLDDKFSWANAFSDEVEEEEEEISPAPRAEGFGEDLDEELNREAAGNHECARTAWTYGELVDAWLKTAGVTYDEKGGAARLPGVDPAEAAKPAEVTTLDALEIVLWFQRFIYIKLMRALSGMLDARGGGNEWDLYDANGSAKIALIAIDRSIAAWGVLVKAVPALRPQAIRMIVLLAGLRRRVEEGLPDARAFVRPGFDTGGENPPEEA